MIQLQHSHNGNMSRNTTKQPSSSNCKSTVNITANIGISVHKGFSCDLGQPPNSSGLLFL